MYARETAVEGRRHREAIRAIHAQSEKALDPNYVDALLELFQRSN